MIRIFLTIAVVALATTAAAAGEESDWVTDRSELRLNLPLLDNSPGSVLEPSVAERQKWPDVILTCRFAQTPVSRGKRVIKRSSSSES